MNGWDIIIFSWLVYSSFQVFPVLKIFFFCIYGKEQFSKLSSLTPGRQDIGEVINIKCEIFL